jgi:uncharacterized damage-inducible protein DinB
VDPRDELAWLADRLERTYREGNWAGKGLAQALEGVTALEAHWRPVTGQRTIAELVAHVAYWCRWTAHHLQPERYPHPGQDWPAVPPTVQAWEEVRRDVEEAHRDCAQAVRAADPALLDRPAPENSGTWREALVDLATHTSYHAAQIFVLRRWYATQDLAL